ncbi:MAG: RNA-binding protein [Ornithinibacter sp.]|nr:RNA-binding protein [Ornithinibacter sp.]
MIVRRPVRTGRRHQLRWGSEGRQGGPSVGDKEVTTDGTHCARGPQRAWGHSARTSLTWVSTPLEVAIGDHSIRLGQLLKLAGLVDDGGAAREVIERGLVAVNGEVETRRGRQLRPGDVVTLGADTIEVSGQA